MPRPCKQRRICAIPSCGQFGPKSAACSNHPPITMTLDEFETIRLIDLMNMTQEECAAQMKVARTTAQSIYNSARRKLAECLVNERELMIQGGDYVLCDGNTDGCKCGKACRHHCKSSGQTVQHSCTTEMEESNHENCSHL